MNPTEQVLEYKCPCCGAGLIFGQDQQKMTCEYCDNTFDLETIRDLEDTPSAEADVFTWSESTTREWSETEQAELNCFTCPACGEEFADNQMKSTNGGNPMPYDCFGFDDAYEMFFLSIK